MCSAELLVLEQPIEPTASQFVSPLELHAFQKDRPGFLPHPSGFPRASQCWARALVGISVLIAIWDLQGFI